jgi:tetratricopeptide (TPR) repeat protein
LSQTYDRNLSDVLALQTEIANAVASALKVTLLGGVAAKIEVGGTQNPAAFDAYLRAEKAYREYQNDKDLQGAIAVYTEAIRLDPEYALAHADRSLAFSSFGNNWTTSPGARRSYYNKAEVDARKAVALAPDLAEGHLALASLFEESLEFMRASHEYDRALALEPGNARLLKDYAWFAVLMGQTESGLRSARRAVALDPLNSDNHYSLGAALVLARRPREAIAVFTDARALTPNDVYATSWLGAAYRALGDFQSARATFESIQAADTFNKLFGLAVTYDKLGRHADAETMLAQLRALRGDSAAVFYSEIYAQWGDPTRALGWLETAMRQQDPYLEYVKMNPLFDPLRNDPRFQAIERALKFPN